MDRNRQRWSEGQQQVRRLLREGEDHDAALHLWLRQHAMLHAGAMAGDVEWSFEDEVADGLTDEQMRWQPADGTHSIVWLLWHIARIEDVTINLLVAGRPQVLDEDGWAARLRLECRDVGTGMEDADVSHVSDRIDVAALRAYRMAVGRRTRAVVGAMSPPDLRRKVEPARVEALLAGDALSAAAYGLAETWATWTMARFLLMPATRHSFTHLNEARRLRGRQHAASGSRRYGSRRRS